MADTAEAVDQILRLDPDALALQFEGRWSTYGAVADYVDQVRDALRVAGVRPGTPVATVLPNRPQGLVAMLAVLLERACLVTISPRRAAEELAIAPPTGALVGPVGAIEALADAVGSTDVAVAACEAVAPEHAGVAVLMSTSGTTGIPRRIPIHHTTIDGVVQGVRGTAARPGGAPGTAAPRLRDDTTLICFPYTSLSGLLPQLIALVSGRRTALLERFDPRTVAALVDQHRMTSLALNPTAMRMLLDADLPPGALASVRFVRSGSAPLSPALAAAFEERFEVGVLQSYGQTEVGGEVVGWSSEDHRAHGVAKRGSVGRPHPGVEPLVVRRGSHPDEDPLPPGEVGELWLRGARNVEGWHRTGDLAHLDDDGFVWIDGRADGLIICGGFNISPIALERVLEAHPSVAEAAVVARPDERLGEVPVAIVVPRSGDGLREPDVLDHCRAHLEPYQVPRAVVVIARLPRNEVGKVHLPSLQALAHD